MDVGTMLVRHEPTSAATVRRAVAEELTERRVGRDGIEDVVLVVSELVTNAVLHTPHDTDLDVAWDLEDDAVLVTVQDASEHAPRVKHVGVDSLDGRGLAIVAAIAREWGVERIEGGKRVWARVAVAVG